MSGLFSTLNTANLGLQAMQSALDVTSHNISNADTAGYTRERVDLSAVGSTKVSIDDGSKVKIGTGVTVDDVSRIRDAMNDYQVREATSENSTLTTTNNYLSQIQNIMNEPSNTGISSLLTSFFSNWSSLSTDSTANSSARTTLVQSAKTLTDSLNNIYNQLENLKSNAQTAIQTQIIDLNSKLNQIDDTNNQIMDMTSTGATPNDLMDQRDSLLDAISSDFNIGISTTSLNGTNVTTTGGAISANGTVASNSLALSTPTASSSENRFAYISDIEATGTAGTYNITYYKNGDMSSSSNKVTLTVSGISNDQLNSLSENRVLVTQKDGTLSGVALTTNADGSSTESGSIDISNLNLLNSTDGSFKGLTQTQQSIDSQISTLNTFAKGIALAVNTVESGSTDATKDTNPFFVNSSAATYTTSNGVSTLNSSYLTNITNSEEGITAGNISINTEILDNPKEVVTGTTSSSGSGDGKRALAISQLTNTNMDIQDLTSTSGRSYFSTTVNSDGITTIAASTNGQTLSGYFTNAITELASTTSTAKSNLTNSTSKLNSLTQTRTSTSGVSTDEEMTNLIQYQHSYAANAKVISTVSSLLDTIINLVQ